MREQIAVFLLNRDEGGNSHDWASHFVASAQHQDHEGDCMYAKNPEPFTCSRCVVDYALKDADAILAIVSQKPACTCSPLTRYADAPHDADCGLSQQLGHKT